MQLIYRSKVHGVSADLIDQRHRICGDCGAYLGIRDNDRRLADHFGGKLHRSFVFIREKLAELKKSAPERREQLRRKQGDSTGSDSRHSVERRRFHLSFRYQSLSLQ